MNGRVLQVNVSAGGVPKLPVECARIGWLGLDGDRHAEPTVHGGPDRAVCLFGIETIGRLRAEGHPLGPGSVGENLTTEGVEWSLLPAGTRVRIGSSVILELSKPAMPCETQRPNFADGRYNRISIRLHPADSRMYARVLVEGEVRPGDAIEILPPADDSLAETLLLLDRLDACEQESDLRLWRAAKAAGHDVRIVDDGELSIVASPDLPGPAFNDACGLRTLPHMIPRVLSHFRRAGVVGWLPSETAPWPDATPDFTLAITAAAPTHVPAADPPPGVTIRAMSADEWPTWLDLTKVALPHGGEHAVDWTGPAPHLLATRGVHVLVAEDDRGVAVGTGTLHVHRRVGLLRAGMVRPEARGQGLQRALIAARARLAQELGCDVLTSQAEPDGPSERNLHRTGMPRIWLRPVYRYDPASAAAA